MLSSLNPIPELDVEDGDMTMLFLSNQALYTDEVTDPWFSATSQNETRGIGLRTQDHNGWRPDHVVSALGCVERYQFCNGDRCTPLSGLYTTNPNEDNGLKLNPVQAAVFNTVWQAAWALKIGFAVVLLGEDMLLAQRFVQAAGRSASSPVYSNQWQREVENIHNVSLAALQRRVVEFAAPPDVATQPGVSSHQFLARPELNSTLGQICRSVKIRSTSHISFSTLGLATILIVGVLVIILNASMESFVFWSRSRGRETAQYKTREWKEGHVLELQRAVFDKQRVTRWDEISRETLITTEYGESEPNLSFEETREKVYLGVPNDKKRHRAIV
jgi:hypothetical protein